MRRLLTGLTVQMALLTALVMGPTWALIGSLEWPRGWLALGILFAASAGGGLFLLNVDPELTRDRATVQPPNTLADGLATALIALAVAGWFVAAAWDAHRLQLIPLPAAMSLAGGAVIFAMGFGLILWTFSVNSFAATIVKVQREQPVIDTGPYAMVRHPMYGGATLFFTGLGLILGSAVAAIVAVPLFALSFTPRMLIEEAVLRQALAGYSGYQTRVRARLLPGLF